MVPPVPQEWESKVAGKKNLSMVLFVNALEYWFCSEISVYSYYPNNCEYVDWRNNNDYRRFVS